MEKRLVCSHTLKCKNEWSKVRVPVGPNRAGISTKNGPFQLWSLMGFRTNYPKIWHLGSLNTLSWRNLKTSKCRNDFLTSPLLCPWSESKGPHVRGVLPMLREKKHPYIQRWRETKRTLFKQVLLRFPQFTTISSFSFVLWHFSMTFYSLSQPVEKCSGLTISAGLHFLIKALMSHKMYIK